MHQLTVIGLGAADFDQLQMGVYKQLKQAKKFGFADSYIGLVWDTNETEIYNIRKENNFGF